MGGSDVRKKGCVREATQRAVSREQRAVVGGGGSSGGSGGDEEQRGVVVVSWCGRSRI